jgi:hypothetical protein
MLTLSYVREPAVQSSFFELIGITPPPAVRHSTTQDDVVVLIQSLWIAGLTYAEQTRFSDFDLMEEVAFFEDDFEVVRFSNPDGLWLDMPLSALYR